MQKQQQWIKQLKKNKKPFSSHITASLLNDHEKNSYAVLHAACVLFNGDISKEQEQLFHLWLAAISPELKLNQVIEQAQNYQIDDLQVGIELIKEYSLNHHFLLDVLVFAFLKGNISDEMKNILNEWCQIFELTQEMVNIAIQVSQKILGAEEKIEDLASILPYLQNPVWLEFYTERVSKDNISHLKQSIYYIDKSLDNIEQNITIENAIVIFTNEASLGLLNNDVVISESILLNPVMSLTSSNLTIEGSTIKGNYEKSKKHTAISLFSHNEVIVNNSSFETIDARTFLFASGLLDARFESSSFNLCGNELLLGGAVSFIEKVYFKDCNFSNCKAQIGGALFFRTAHENNMVNCNFKNCLSTTEWKESVDAGAIYIEATSTEDMHCIVNCNIKGDISTFFLKSHKIYRQTLSKTYLSGCIYSKKVYSHDCNHMLDNESIALSGVTYSYEKNRQYDSVKNYNELIAEFG